MNSKAWGTIALVTGAVALFFGIWGFVERGNSGNDEAAIEDAMMWIALSIIVLAISAIANALADRGTR